MPLKAALTGVAQAALRRLVPADESLCPEPVSRSFGLDRGQPIDRFYISKFILDNEQHIRGTAVEVAEPRYLTAYRDRLQKIEILHVSPGAKDATIVADLSDGTTLPSAVADCFVCTQTYQFIFDVAAAIRGSAQLLRPGGTLLATVPGISQVSQYDMQRWGDYWRFTTASVRRLMETVFRPELIEVVSYGNVLAASAFLSGLSVDDLKNPNLLDVADPDYPVIITVRATKP